jgi:hypothetical protein
VEVDSAWVTPTAQQTRTSSGRSVSSAA